jgi:DNA-binding FadR family transcriptional regulator
VLIGDIVAGTFAPGTTLPKEDDLAARLGVSRGTARECVQRLEERGLVEVKHGRGTLVRADDEWSRFDPDVLAALLGGERAATVLGEYLECRRLLEVEAAGLAAERASATAVERLRTAFVEMREAAERARTNAAAEGLYHEADIGFHRAVVRATGNPTLGQMTAPIHRALATTFGALARPRERFVRSLPEHERILEAISQHDPSEAREAMRAHLLTVERYLREYGGRAASEFARP